MAEKADLSRISESDFSNLLQALSTSPKGLAFLEEYRRRVQPEETLGLLDSLQRMDATLATLREQLQPEKIAEELARIGMTMEIALEGTQRDPEGDENARRFALIERTRKEVLSLAGSLAGETAPSAGGPAVAESPAIQLIEDETRFFDELGLEDQGPPPER